MDKFKISDLFAVALLLVSVPGPALAQDRQAPSASPAKAASSGKAIAKQAPTEIPAPSDLTLFAMGLAGLLIARRVARQRKDEE